MKSVPEAQYQDEFYRFPEPPLSRDKVHVLMSIDIDKTDLNQGRGCARPCVRPDGDYALSWIRREGRGRVFYEAHGHSERVYAIKPMLVHLLNGMQYVLGDLRVDDRPRSDSERLDERLKGGRLLTPARVIQEEPVEGRAPVLEDPHELPPRDGFGRVLLEQEG